MMKIYRALLIFLSVECFAGDDIIFINGFELEPASCQKSTLFTDDFNRPNQNDWGLDWQESGTSIELAEIINNEGRLVPLASNSPYSLARIFHPLDNAIDVEATFSIIFENSGQQGIGFYLRSNGGHLVHTDPMGQGYAVFIERFVGGESRIGLWYEHDGIESPFIRQPLMPNGSPYNFVDGVKYNVRFQVFQEDAETTRIRAKIWQTDLAEPDQWGVNLTDNYLPLQNTSGGIAVDSYDTQSEGTITNGTRIDDIEIKQLCNPLLKLSTPVEIINGLQFAEGPVWKDNALLFSDINANRIYQWQQHKGVTVFNEDSGNANGLAKDADNNLVAAEHGNRRVSITDSKGTTTLVEDYQGSLFNSPNDVIYSNAGYYYFTDPDYGLNGRPREIDFNGVYKFDPLDGLSLQYMGNSDNNKPNGILLIENQNSLIWSDTNTGIIHKMDVGVDGELEQLREFTSGLDTPDGMCIDSAGNVYIATWNSAVEVYAENGDYWGAISMPDSSITNCTFGGANDNQLFVTSTNRVFQSVMTQ